VLRGAYGFFAGYVAVFCSFIVLVGVALLFQYAPLLASTVLGAAVVLVVVSRRSRLRRLGIAGRTHLRRLAVDVYARCSPLGIPCLAVLVLLLFAYFVWPTLFTYHAVGGRLVRVNRITGTASYVPIQGLR
jgi:dolichyl-phosphate-mannose--protein O-mannosyl transferase